MWVASKIALDWPESPILRGPSWVRRVWFTASHRFREGQGAEADEQGLDGLRAPSPLGSEPLNVT